MRTKRRTGTDDQETENKRLREINEALLLDLQVIFDAIDGDPRAVQFFDLTFMKKVKADIAKAKYGGG